MRYYICVMKWLMILASIYVLLLSGIPCCGNDACCREEYAWAESGAHHDHADNSKPGLPCSPFFSCTTCHALVAVNHTVNVPLPTGIEKKLLFSYIDKSLPTFAAAVWQPPQTIFP